MFVFFLLKKLPRFQLENFEIKNSEHSKTNHIVNSMQRSLTVEDNEANLAY